MRVQQRRTDVVRFAPRCREDHETRTSRRDIRLSQRLAEYVLKITTNVFQGLRTPLGKVLVARLSALDGACPHEKCKWAFPSVHLLLALEVANRRPIRRAPRAPELFPLLRRYPALCEWRQRRPQLIERLHRGKKSVRKLGAGHHARRV